MGFIGKVTRAVTLWTNTDFRRAEVLAETIFYGTGMAMIGVVFTILAATGTFPASIDVMKARNTYALTIAKYILYALSGAGAYLAAKSARSSLRNGRPTTVAKGILELSAAGVLASAVMTVASMVISSQDSHSTPVWAYIIQVVVLFVRLLFLSVLVMAIYTLFEADRNPDVAAVVAGMSNSALPSGKPPSKGRTTSPAAAYYPPVVVNHPAALHAAQMHHTPPSGVYAQPPAVPTGHVPMQQHHLQYPPQPRAQHQPMPPQAAAAPSDAVPQPLAATGHTHAFAGSNPPGNMPPAPLWPQAGGTQPQFINPQFAQQHFAQPQFVQQQLGAQQQFAQAQFAQPPPVAMAPVGVAAPAAARGRQGPSMLGTLVAFRMGQRAGRRQQQRRMGRRC